MDCSKVDFRSRFLKGSNLNQNTGLQQRKHLICALSTGTDSAAFHRDGFKAAQTGPLTLQHSGEMVKTCPLLLDLLSEKPSGCFTTKSSPEETMLLNSNVPGRRRRTGQRVKGSLAVLDCEQTSTQHLHPAGGTPSNPHRQGSSPSLGLQPSTGWSVGDRKPPTDEDIHRMLLKKLDDFRNDINQKKMSAVYSDELGMDSVLKSVESHLPTTSGGEDPRLEECSAAAEQYNCSALEEDHSNGFELTAQFNKLGDCATAASEKHSTGILVTAVEHSKHCLTNASVEKSALVVVLSVKKHLGVSVHVNLFIQMTVKMHILVTMTVSIVNGARGT